MKPNCYECKFRRELAGDSHSSCANPHATPLALLVFARGGSEIKTNNIHVRGNTHGVRSGWFNWPLNFDPTWLEICSGFEAKGGDVENMNEKNNSDLSFVLSSAVSPTNATNATN